MLGKLVVGEIAVGGVVTGEIVLGKLRWGNDLTPYRLYPPGIRHSYLKLKSCPSVSVSEIDHRAL